jgi:hypothetical protein
MAINAASTLTNVSADPVPLPLLASTKADAAMFRKRHYAGLVALLDACCSTFEQPAPPQGQGPAVQLVFGINLEHMSRKTSQCTITLIWLTKFLVIQVGSQQLNGRQAGV